MILDISHEEITKKIAKLKRKSNKANLQLSHFQKPKRKKKSTKKFLVT